MGISYYIDKSRHSDSCAYNNNTNSEQQSQQKNEQKQVKKPEESEQKDKVSLGGDWKLYDTNNKLISQDYFKGKYYLLYFGFTECPEICPNSLSKISQAVNLLKEDKNIPKKLQQIQPCFVTIDPERDTAEKIKKFTNIFSKDIMGLRKGESKEDEEEYKEILLNYRIYATQIPFEDAESGKNTYTIDHTDIIYLMGPDNEYIAPVFSHQEPDELRDLIVRKVQEFENQ